MATTRTKVKQAQQTRGRYQNRMPQKHRRQGRSQLEQTSGRQPATINTIKRSSDLPLIHISDLTNVHYTQCMHMDASLAIHLVKELYTIIRTIDKNIDNLEVKANEHPQNVLRLLIERYLKLTSCEFLSIRLEGTHGIDFNASILNTSSDYKVHQFLAWSPCKEVMFDVYMYELEESLQLFMREAALELYKMMCTLLDKLHLVQFNEDVTDICCDYLVECVGEGLFAEDPQHEANVKICIEDYCNGGKASKMLNNIFGKVARNVCSEDIFIRLTKKFRPQSAIEKKLKAAARAFIEVIKDHEGRKMFDFQPPSYNESLSVYQCYCFVYSMQDELYHEIHSTYSETINNYGINKIHCGVINSTTSGKMKTQDFSGFSKKFFHMLNLFTLIQNERPGGK